MLQDFCRAADVNEVYLAFPSDVDPADENRIAHLINLLHGSQIRVEALLSSTDADEPGKHRDKLMEHLHAVQEYNRTHPKRSFDGIHLDIEPQQRPENKGPGNLNFLSNLVDAYRQVRREAQADGLTVNADIQIKLLKGTLAERKMLLSSLPRLTLMLYELSSPGDGEGVTQKKDKLRRESQKYLEMAYEGLDSSKLATMGIGLRFPDYQQMLPEMLRSLDDAHRSDPHYRGWAEHSYNDLAVH